MKTFAGVRLRRLREERRLTQSALAKAIDISPSYLNQIEQNQRPLTVSVLLKLTKILGVDAQLFSEDDEARMVSSLRDIVAEASPEESIATAELREVARQMPAVGRLIQELHARYRTVLDQNAAFSAGIGEDRQADLLAMRPTAYEEVRDIFARNRNYLPALDEAAERIGTAWPNPTRAAAGLRERLEHRHGVRIASWEDTAPALRSFDPASRVLMLSSRLRPGQQAFQLATQLALLEARDEIDGAVADAGPTTDEARKLLRVGLANYFAGALVLPYRAFLAAAEQVRYDIDALSCRFGLGFETICHRLSTLQRPDARGVPFFFIRVDRAGNISKRQSATDFHFSKVGGTCPLWNVYEAFAQPGRTLTQVAAMPDGRTYLWIARTVARSSEAFGAPPRTFAVGLGCDLHRAEQLVYSRGLDLTDRAAATPIGMGCKVCERPACPQRAFPALGRPLEVSETVSGLAPYAGKAG
ncbi:transcriptional regulator, XRE family [Methylobacterium sp. ap11]|uniref:short-chain fatty acyl-CoA regulator family protein n=1 Tax=Methylobacterium sp. ap11 TaxID=1761799 RepID=UPI0008C20163|nr:short-chain fatty acyl-CoA regulator family protein [Methylobacterium sp. ap11]SEP41938.1 transcriptional regulator, XRE family [Methylobacterium sp. ap11]